MPIKTFKKIVKTYKEKIEIGGGEPTVHPEFWEIIDIAVNSQNSVWVCTNGKRTEDALKINKLAKEKRIQCELSQTIWHEKIDAEVVELFRKTTDEEHIRIKRVYSTNILNRGRAKINKLGIIKHPYNNKCWGNVGKFILPNGDIKWCKCANAPIIGNVFNGIKEEYEKVFKEKDCFNHKEGDNYWNYEKEALCQ